MDDMLTIEEINRQYPDEWVLIGDPETDESLEVLSGKVLYHGNSRDEMLRVAKELPSPKRFATHYTGDLFPEDMEYCLNWGLPGGLGLSAEEWEQFFKEQAAQTHTAAVNFERS